MKKILIVIFAATLFVLGRNLLFPIYTKKGVLYHRDILGHITLAEDFTYPDGYTPGNTYFPYPTSTPNPYTIKFDLMKAQVGDKVGSMTITNISGFKVDKPSDSYGEGTVSFKGQITVTGTLEYVDSKAQLGERVCMDNLDNISQSKIPDIIGSSGDGSFCFDNWQTIKEIVLGKEISKKATVVIDNYFIFNIPIDGFNSATFILEVK